MEDRCQRHREAPGKLSAALKDLASRRLDCVVHLGDIINGNTTDEASLKDFDLIARIFDTELVRLCVVNNIIDDVFLRTYYYHRHLTYSFSIDFYRQLIQSLLFTCWATIAFQCQDQPFSID